MTRSRALRGLLVVGLCAAMVALSAMKPDGAQKGGPIVRDGQVGELVRGDSLQLRVSRVQVATRVADPRGGGPVEPISGFVFVVVTGKVTVSDESPELWYLEVYDDDEREYQVMQDFSDQTLDGTKLHPGIPSTGAFFAQLPRDAVVGSRITASLEEFPPFREEVRIDLGVDDRDVRRGLRSQAKVTVPKPRYG